MKLKIMYLLIIFIIPLAIALEECELITEISEIPCRVTTTWIYPNNCTTYTVQIYDGYNGSLLDIRNMDSYGYFCNFTFNYSYPGSYYWNISSGDTGQIKAVEKMQNIYNFLVFGGFFVMILTLIVFMHVFKSDRGAPLVYGIIAGTLSLIMVAIIASGWQVVRGVIFIIDVNYYLMALMAGIAIYCAMVSYAFYTDYNPKEEY